MFDARSLREYMVAQNFILRIINELNEVQNLLNRGAMGFECTDRVRGMVEEIKNSNRLMLPIKEIKHHQGHHQASFRAL